MNTDNYNPNEKSSLSQAKRILAYMQAGHSINPLEALRLFGCFRLGARIKDIEAIIGRSPSRRKIQVKNRGGKAVWVCEYWLEETLSRTIVSCGSAMSTTSSTPSGSLALKRRLSYETLDDKDHCICDCFA